MTEPLIEIERPILELGDQYEVVNGQIVEEPGLGADEGSTASALGVALASFVQPRKLGRVVFEVLMILEKEPRLRRRPDIAFVSSERWPIKRRPSGAAWDVIPDLAVEVVSPTDHAHEVMDKIEEYFRAGVRLVWVVYSAHLKIYVYTSPTTIEVKQVGDDLGGGTVVPGFQMSLATIFEVEDADPTPEAG